ncbi:uncharacterized protein N7515_004565 [Penicillium bovifimosum]|uniref:Uncharacterized protein n=1 Tax=Penicillium bovifimosum TaxID=126998 RepID=A0A9W9L412_9EURO|nr:uncharacterized protein N7515_004565 [Penicillium bovifimosum]KAJ5135287.1 hypothetical protein N7515_004565 [Penicillium bovifimosum]
MMAQPTSQSKRGPSAFQSGKIEGFKIPKTYDEWLQLVGRKAELKHATIHTIPPPPPNGLRQLRKRHTLNTQCFYGFSPAVLTAASDALGGSIEWSRYLQLIQASTSIDRINENDPTWPGAFAAVKRLQEQTTNVGGVSDASSHPAADTRSTLTHVIGSELEWVFNRIHFSCQLQATRFNAFTDGALRSKQNQRVFAILEAKKRSRGKDSDPIIMQEACQVAAWSSSSGRAGACFNDHFLLIPQNRDALFLTFVPFVQEYQNHLRNGANAGGFLVMKTFGPFRTTMSNEMAEFGIIIAAAGQIASSAISDV